MLFEGFEEYKNNAVFDEFEAQEILDPKNRDMRLDDGAVWAPKHDP